MGLCSVKVGLRLDSSGKLRNFGIHINNAFGDNCKHHHYLTKERLFKSASGIEQEPSGLVQSHWDWRRKLAAEDDALMVLVAGCSLFASESQFCKFCKYFKRVALNMD